jgi:ferredoxin-NADP reductase
MKFETWVKEIIPRTADISSFRFPRPAEFAYKPGQYIVCTIKTGEREIVHHFSISSSPTEPDFLEFTKKFTTNEYSLALKTLKAGAWARLDGPYGKFTFEGEYPKIALLTGGIGITPFRSIIKYCTDKNLATEIALFYGCKTPADLAFKNEFDQLQTQNSKFKPIYTVNAPTSDWIGSVGNITENLVKKEMPDFKDRIFYACGPPGMVTAMTDLIKRLGLPETQLKLEFFSGYT